MPKRPTRSLDELGKSRWLTAVEAARYTGISIDALYRLRNMRKITTSEIHKGAILFERESVEKYIAERIRPAI